MMTEQPANAERPTPGDAVVIVRQYYYHVGACKAATSRDADCICWHDEGTGPMPDGCWYDAKGNRMVLEWRDVER